MKNKMFLIGFIVFGLLLVNGCDDSTSSEDNGDEYGSLFSIQISPSGLVIEKDSTAQLQAVGKDANGILIPNVSFTWQSSDDNVATVDNNGIVTGIFEGGAYITAKSGNVTSEPAGVIVNWPIESKLSGQWHTVDFTSAPDIEYWFSDFYFPIYEENYSSYWVIFNISITKNLQYTLYDSASWEYDRYDASGVYHFEGGNGRLLEGTIAFNENSVPISIDLFDENGQLIYYGIIEFLSTDFTRVRVEFSKSESPIYFTDYWILNK